MKNWHEINDIPEYDNHVIILYASGVLELFYFWGTSWTELVNAISQNCNIHTGQPVAWAYVPREDV